MIGPRKKTKSETSQERLKTIDDDDLPLLAVDANPEDIKPVISETYAKILQKKEEKERRKAAEDARNAEEVR